MAAKKPRIDRSLLEFKSKGNEDQYTFNEKVEELLTQTSKQLEKLSALVAAPDRPHPAVLTATTAKAKKTLDQDITLVTHTQKLIRLADRSEHGWRFVKEYESDTLADDDEDEKRIAKAEKAAKKQFAQAAAKMKKSVPKLLSSARVPQFQHYQQSNRQDPWVPRGKTTPPVLPGRSLGPRPLGPCFRCREMGLLQNACPKMATPYPYTNFEREFGCGEHPDESLDESHMHVELSRY